MNLIRILAGVLALSLGRRLFWFFVSLAGFALGISLAGRLLLGQPDWLVLLVALLAGLVGALLAVFAQHLAVGLAGAAAGGYTTFAVLDVLRLDLGAGEWVLAVVTSVIGLALALVVFEWALIILSSLIGAGLIVQGLNLDQPLGLLAFVGCVAFGIMLQVVILQRSSSTRQRKRRSR